MTCRLFFLAYAFVVPTLAWSWGENGHDAVARAATRILSSKADAKDRAALVTPFLKRAHMLAHLANVPDIVWRAADQSNEVTAANAKTHYINPDKLLPPSGNCLELAMPASEARRLLKQGNLADEVGTGPWRLDQFYRRLVTAFAKLKPLAVGSAAANDQIDDALMQAGLFAHFVGDLAQPMHATNDYDGWEHLQGGLHEYFESTLVDSFGLDLADIVYKQALKTKPVQNVLEPILTNKMANNTFPESLKMAFALTCNSHDANPRLFALDLKRAVIKPSPKDKSKPAQRRSAANVRPYFESLILDRLSLGADVLAALWFKAWVEGGRPDMSAYKSYAYPTAPSYIPTDY